MGYLADSGLLLQATPALADLGADGQASETRSWKWELTDVIDGSGAPFDFTTVHAYCSVYAGFGGPQIVGLDCTWETVDGKTRLTLSKNDDDTIGLADGRRFRDCPWELVLTDEDDSLTIWGPSNSILTIKGRG